jgi:hypothetical protein
MPEAQKPPQGAAFCIVRDLSKLVAGTRTQRDLPAKEKGPQNEGPLSSFGHAHQVAVVAGVRNQRQQRKTLHAVWDIGPPPPSA